MDGTSWARKVGAGLSRGAAVAALAVAVALPAAAPARAAGFDQVKQMGDEALSLFVSAGRGELTDEQLYAAVRRFVDVVGAAEDAVLRHLDEVGAAPWVGAAEHAILEVPSLPDLTEDTLEEFALDVTLYARQAKATFDAVSSDAVADHLGFAVYALYAVALEARVWGNLNTSTTFMPSYRTAMEAIVRRLEPRCTGPREGELDYHPSIYHMVYECTTPNGTVTLQDYQVDGVWREGPYTPETLRTTAGARTSWAIARDVLRRMENEGIRP
ncbi:hypothetical protein [Jidongwangia harbinensis]|uniref:hypothetical protein n=1 Tax=Jidongwangia harbinensis TaxID=2878561 RepID=UPI001CD98D37|nr:hypothetical protein [Jidongwangia harbinensis]MCA2211757.1 hypothetical protein [Jidongwangia harbinensis]